MPKHKGRGWLWLIPILIVVATAVFLWLYYVSLIASGAIIAILSQDIFANFVNTEFGRALGAAIIIDAILIVVWAIATRRR